MIGFSSPFIEERLYFYTLGKIDIFHLIVLVPFYRGAVVFDEVVNDRFSGSYCSRPLLSRSGCIYSFEKICDEIDRFSSPFIEERLYF